MMRYFIACWLVLSALLLAGCGGGGGGSKGSAGSVSMTVQWPQRSRDVGAPSSALSFVLTVAQALPTGQDLVISGNRSGDASAHTETYTSPKAKKGTFAYQLKFYSDANAGGTVVATAGGNLVINGTTSLPNVTLDSKVASATIAADQSIVVGQTKVLSVEARDAEGAIVAVSPGSFVWTIQTGQTFLSVTGDNFQGSSSGDATVAVSIDGIQSQPVTVHVLGITEVTIKVASATTWVAFQDGTGAWVQKSIPADRLVRGTVTDASQKYGWALANAEQIGTSVERWTDVYLSTVAEARHLTDAPSFNQHPSRRVSLTFAGTVQGERVHYSHGTYKRLETIQANISSNSLCAYTEINGVIQRMAILRDIPDTATSITMDFRGPDSFVPELVQYPSVVGGVSLRLDGNSPESGTFDCPLIENGGSRYFSLPPADKLRADDSYESFAVNGTITEGQQGVAVYGLADGRNADYSSVGPWQPSFAKNPNGKSVDVTLPELPSATSYRISGSAFELRMSAGWHGSGTLQFSTPDLSSVAGWDSQFPQAQPSPYAFAQVSVWNLSFEDRMNSWSDYDLARQNAIHRYVWWEHFF